MQILRVHNRYRHRAGEDAVFDCEVKLLRDRGHDVHLLVVSNDDIPSSPPLTERVRLAIQTIWSEDGRRIVGEAIDAYCPDIVHFDNTFPLISPAAYSAARERGVAVVQTLHNYRLVCPAATLYRSGSVCEDCLGKHVPYPGFVHGCYRQSRSQTLAVAGMLMVHGIRRTWSSDVDRFVVLSEFARSKLIEGGLPEELMSVKSNFVDGSEMHRSSKGEDFLYVGRLSREKGVATLLNSVPFWPVGLKLRIAGDGLLRREAQRCSEEIESVEYLGNLPESEIYNEMAVACAVIVPSEWHEPFGRVVIEAFACGTPVIAARSGGITELVSEGSTGLLFDPGDERELANTVSWAREHPEQMMQMGSNARLEYQLKYTPEQNYDTLMDIYQGALAHSSKR